MTNKSTPIEKQARTTLSAKNAEEYLELTATSATAITEVVEKLIDEDFIDPLGLLSTIATSPKVAMATDGEVVMIGKAITVVQRALPKVIADLLDTILTRAQVVNTTATKEVDALYGLLRVRVNLEDTTVFEHKGFVLTYKRGRLYSIGKVDTNQGKVFFHNQHKVDIASAEVLWGCIRDTVNLPNDVVLEVEIQEGVITKITKVKPSTVKLIRSMPSLSDKLNRLNLNTAGGILVSTLGGLERFISRYVVRIEVLRDYPNNDDLYVTF